MPGAISVLFQQISMLWKHLGLNQKVSIVLAFSLAISLIAGTIYWTSRPDYRLLYTGLSMEDAAKARERLEEERIPVSIRSHGQALYVPAADVYRARLMLASDGLPREHGAGFELFEQPKFGLTEFAQQVNFQRALQGELERTIMAVDGVQGARVLLVLPKDRLFATERDKSASASIMLTMSRGMQLRPEQVHSIRQLIGTAVPGMHTGHVTITDHMGRMLSDSSSSNADPILGASKSQLEMRRAFETELTRKAQDILDVTLGEGQSVVRVSADMDFRKIEKHNETYDAEGRVLIRETISTESSSEPTRNAGTAAARVAVGDPAANVTMEPGRTSNSKREDIDSEYYVPSGREIIIDQGGRVQRLSVSVSIAQGEEPRNAEDLQHIERLVRSAVGAISSTTRQDEVAVVEMKFKNTTSPDMRMANPWWHRFAILPANAMRTIGALALLFTLFMFSRRAFRSLAVESESVGTPVSMLSGNTTANELPNEMDMPQPMDREETEIDMVSRLAEQNPAAVATWIDHAVRGNG